MNRSGFRNLTRHLLNMKHLAAALVSAALWASGSAEATPGDFSPGEEFTLTVGKRFTQRTVGDRDTMGAGGTTVRGVPVPADVPDYRTGQRIRFRIGPAGQLVAGGLSIPFRADFGTYNTYLTTRQVRRGAKVVSNQATVFKARSGASTRAKSVELAFTRTVFRDNKVTMVTVSYSLD